MSIDAKKYAWSNFGQAQIKQYIQSSGQSSATTINLTEILSFVFPNATFTAASATKDDNSIWLMTLNGFTTAEVVRWHDEEDNILDGTTGPIALQNAREMSLGTLKEKTYQNNQETFLDKAYRNQDLADQVKQVAWKSDNALTTLDIKGLTDQFPDLKYAKLPRYGWTESDAATNGVDGLVNEASQDQATLENNYRYQNSQPFSKYTENWSLSKMPYVIYFSPAQGNKTISENTYDILEVSTEGEDKYLYVCNPRLDYQPKRRFRIKLLKDDQLVRVSHKCTKWSNPSQDLDFSHYPGGKKQESYCWNEYDNDFDTRYWVCDLPILLTWKQAFDTDFTIQQIDIYNQQGAVEKKQWRDADLVIAKGITSGAFCRTKTIQIEVEQKDTQKTWYYAPQVKIQDNKMCFTRTGPIERYNWDGFIQMPILYALFQQTASDREPWWAATSYTATQAYLYTSAYGQMWTGETSYSDDDVMGASRPTENRRDVTHKNYSYAYFNIGIAPAITLTNSFVLTDEYITQVLTPLFQDSTLFETNYQIQWAEFDVSDNAAACITLDYKTGSSDAVYQKHFSFSGPYILPGFDTPHQEVYSARGTGSEGWLDYCCQDQGYGAFLNWQCSISNNFNLKIQCNFPDQLTLSNSTKGFTDCWQPYCHLKNLNTAAQFNFKGYKFTHFVPNRYAASESYACFVDPDQFSTPDFPRSTITFSDSSDPAKDFEEFIYILYTTRTLTAADIEWLNN